MDGRPLLAAHGSRLMGSSLWSKNARNDARVWCGTDVWAGLGPLILPFFAFALQRLAACMCVSLLSSSRSFGDCLVPSPVLICLGGGGGPGAEGGGEGEHYGVLTHKMYKAKHETTKLTRRVSPVRARPASSVHGSGQPTRVSHWLPGGLRVCGWALWVDRVSAVIYPRALLHIPTTTYRLYIFRGSDGVQRRPFGSITVGGWTIYRLYSVLCTEHTHCSSPSSRYSCPDSYLAGRLVLRPRDEGPHQSFNKSRQRLFGLCVRGNTERWVALAWLIPPISGSEWAW